MGEFTYRLRASKEADISWTFTQNELVVTNSVVGEHYREGLPYYHRRRMPQKL